MPITENDCQSFAAYLRGEKRGAGTIEKYPRDLRQFTCGLNGRELTRELASVRRDCLLDQGYAPATINSMLSAVNHFPRFAGREYCKIKFLRVQRRVFREQARELTREEYQRLPAAAREQERECLGLLMETICATGIRVSEVGYITVEAARRGRAEVCLKGKICTIMLPGKLCRKLLKYAQKQKPPPASVRRRAL